MQITYSDNAWIAEVEIEGIAFSRGETKDVPDATATSILKNPNFTDKDGRNAYSDPLPEAIAAPTPITPVVTPSAKSGAQPAQSAAADKSSPSAPDAPAPSDSTASK